MHRIPSRSPRLVITACCVLVGSAALRAQVVTEPLLPNELQNPGSTAVSAPAPAQPEAQATAPEPPAPARVAAPSRHLFVALYAGLVATQALDVHSTLRALNAGHKEANPIVRWATSHPVALVGLKAVATTGTTFLIERVRKQHPKRALLLLAGIDTAYAIVVAHNYSAPVPHR